MQGGATLEKGTCLVSCSLFLPGEALALPKERQPPPLCESPRSEGSEELLFSGMLLKQKLHRKTLFKAVEIGERGQNSSDLNPMETNVKRVFQLWGELAEVCWRMSGAGLTMGCV